MGSEMNQRYACDTGQWVVDPARCEPCVLKAARCDWVGVLSKSLLSLRMAGADFITQRFRHQRSGVLDRLGTLSCHD